MLYSTKFGLALVSPLTKTWSLAPFKNSVSGENSTGDEPPT
jgi:hypothetical protein